MLGIVTGLRQEARLAAPFGMTLAGGGTASGARHVAEALVARGADMLVSFGLAGGIDPGLPAGALIIPAHVLGVTALYAVDRALLERLGGPTVPILADLGRVVASAADKARLWAASGAAAVDMESASVAAVAAEHGVPFIVLRAVCDPAGRDLPPAALAALNSAGGIALGRILRSVLGQPRQIPDLLRLSRDASAAHHTLARHAGRLRLLAAAAGG